MHRGQRIGTVTCIVSVEHLCACGTALADLGLPLLEPLVLPSCRSPRLVPVSVAVALVCEVAGAACWALPFSPASRHGPESLSGVWG